LFRSTFQKMRLCESDVCLSARLRCLNSLVFVAVLGSFFIPSLVEAERPEEEERYGDHRDMAPFQGVKQNIQEKLAEAAAKLVQSSKAQADITQQVAGHISQYRTHVQNIAATMSEVMKAKKVLTSAYHEDLSHGEESRAAALEVNLNDAFGDEEDVTLPPSGAFSATSQAALGPPQPQEPVSDRLENDAADVNQELSAEVHEDAAAPAADEVTQVQELPAEVNEDAAAPAANEVQDEELEQDGSPVEADAAAAADAALTAQGQEHDAKLAEALSAREEAPARVENGGAAPPDIESVASDSEASQSEGDEVAAALEKERRKKVATALAPTESNSAEQVDQGSVNVPVESASTSAGGDQDANDATREDQDANMDLEESLAQLGAVNMHRHQQQHLQHRQQRLQHRQQHFQHRQGQERLQHRQQHFQHRQQRFQHRQQRQQRQHRVYRHRTQRVAPAHTRGYGLTGAAQARALRRHMPANSMLQHHALLRHQHTQRLQRQYQSSHQKGSHRSSRHTRHAGHRYD